MKKLVISLLSLVMFAQAQAGAIPYFGEIEKVDIGLTPDRTIKRLSVEMPIFNHDNGLMGDYVLNKVDIDGDGEKELIAINTAKTSCNNHGCSFLMFKDNGEHFNVLASGFVPVINGVAQLDSGSKILFATKSITESIETWN